MSVAVLTMPADTGKSQPHGRINVESSIDIAFKWLAFTPYGYTPLVSSELGFNGEHRNTFGLYVLGQGYRHYSPSLARFLTPDTLSPLYKGGLNAYAYCQGDPINHTDPSGHIAKRIYNHFSGKYNTGTLKRKLERLNAPNQTDLLSKENTFSKREFKHLEDHLINTSSFSSKLENEMKFKIQRDTLKSESPLSEKDRQFAILKNKLKIRALGDRKQSADTYLGTLRQFQPVIVEGKKRFASPKLIRDPASLSN